MKEFYAGYKVSDYAYYAEPPYRGHGWHISFEEDTTPGRSRSQTSIDGVLYPGKMVVIHAHSEERAHYVADLIYASELLMRGEHPPFGRTTVTAMPSDSSEHSEATDTQHVASERPAPWVETSGLPYACMIAAKASHRRTYQYALFKHSVSHELVATSINDLSPSHWWPRPVVSPYADYHVHCAYAIVAAYSVLEELSLEVRASQQLPSTIDGEWNPEVRAELEGRLRRAGIDVSQTFLWTMRDTPTRVERTRPPRVQSKAPWGWRKIRDSEIEVVDAIAYASWLRSRVSAHRLRDLAGSLTYYDVANVQHLARRLLLEKMNVDPGYRRPAGSWAPVPQSAEP